MDRNEYWDKFWRRRASRRALLRGSAVGAAGLAAAIALGCEEEEKPAATATPAEGTPTAATPTPKAVATLEPEFANAKYGGILNIDQGDEPVTLDNHIEEAPGSVYAANLAYNHLMRRWEDYEKEPGKVFVGPELASEWEQIDELTYRFKLVQNAKWHNLPPVNGRPFTAADVKYSFERMIDPTILESRTRSSLEAIDTIETPDDFTVVFKTKAPFAPFITNAGHTWAVIMPRELAETEDVKHRSIGTGPFIFKRWQRGVQLEWERNPEYFRVGHPFIQKVIMRIVPDRAGQVADFRVGEIDTYGGSRVVLPAEVLQDLKESVPDAIEVEVPAVAGFYYHAYFDTRSEPFKDKRLRLAIEYGFNYAGVIKMLGGLAKRTGTLPAGMIEWALKEEDLLPQDMDKGKALLAEAGYGPDNPLKVTTSISQFYGGPEISQVVKAFLKPLGIEVTIEMMENAEWLQKVYRGGESFQMSSHADWGFEDPDRQLYTYFHSKGANNAKHLTDAELDRLLEAQRREFDLAKRKELVRQIQIKILQEAYDVPIVAPGASYLRRSWLRNYKQMLQGNYNGYRQWDNVWYDPMPPGRAT